MKSLNLTDPKNSEIKYLVSKFPDGQQQLKILNVEEGRSSGLLPVHQADGWAPPDPYQVKSRLTSFKDLELILCAVASLRELGVINIHLYISYFIGARSDRKFEEGSNNYLKTIICPIINSLNLSSVTVLDAHSDVLEMGLNNYRKVDNVDFVERALKAIAFSTGKNLADVIIVSPDAGALKKIYNVTEKIGYKGKIAIASKHRDTAGKITHTNISGIGEAETKDLIIIDDICDGGATFIGISAAANDAGHQGKKYLLVTHGIFSVGLKTLNQYFDGIYCTNSFRSVGEYEHDGNNLIKTNVKQLNVI